MAFFLLVAWVALARARLGLCERGEEMTGNPAKYKWPAPGLSFYRSDSSAKADSLLCAVR